jgi:hypothetical protein
MVGEFKMILSPVDAEMGRGNAQIQIATKSGGNKWHGSAVWNVQNTALDPNTWDNNRKTPVVDPPWRNLHEGTVSASGPIVKNKSFFFVLYNFQIANTRSTYNAMSLTPCARKGIFRYYDNWNNQNALYSDSSSAASAATANPYIAVVDAQGNPRPPSTNPDGTAANGILRYASPFGTISNLSTLAPDCSNAQVSGAPWQAIRPTQDPSGFIADFLTKLPAANNYDIGDGLNLAGFRWSRSNQGSINLWGIGEDTYRKSINIRIDHNFNAKHRINGSWSYDKIHADDTPWTWPEFSWSGGGINKPQVLTVNFLSNISATILNEVRFGMSRTGSNIYTPADRPGNGDTLAKYLAQFGSFANGEVGVVEAGPPSGIFNNFRTDGGTFFASSINVSSPYGTRGGWAIGDLFDTSPRYSIGDSMTWIRGTHSFRFGGEWRRQNSESRGAWLFNPSNFQWGDSFPEIQGGELPLTPNTSADFANFPGVMAGSDANNGNKRLMRDMLVFQSGSLGSIKQVRYINRGDETTWNNPVEEPLMIRNTYLQEFSLFFKDDWKIRNDLTLNLGIRWDYYGVPWLANGMTVGLEGGGSKIFGPTDSYDNWFQPISAGDTPSGDLVALQSIGPGGENPDIPLYPKTWTNWGPAVGAAWELPWFGKGQTTLRGGYQRTFISMSGNFQYVESAAGASPGFFNINVWNNGGTGTWVDPNSYFGIKDIATNPIFANGVPVPSTVQPGLTSFDPYDRQQSISSYASDYGYPHVDNLTFAITRNVGSALTVDLRYIGTFTRRNFSSKDINVANFLSNGLLEAFNEARAGRDPALLDQLLNGLNLNPFGTCGTVNGTTCKGGRALREAAWPNFNVPAFAPGWFVNLNQMLALGNYQALANSLHTETRYYGDQRGKYIEDNGFPVNFLKASPQFNTATLYENKGYSNYNSFQAQVTLRPMHGLSFQSTYTWSKNMANSGGLDPIPTDPDTGYTLAGMDRTHNWVTFGTYDLPFGPGRQVGGSTHGAWGKVLGGWQLGWISTVTSGAPLSLTANCGLYSNCAPEAVNGGVDPSIAEVVWGPDSENMDHGSLFNNRYGFVKDPQCTDPSIIDPSLQALCTLQAVTDKENGDRVVLQNPLPGQLGSAGWNQFRNETRWGIDMSVSKLVAIDESKTFRLRVDITNIFNHPVSSGSPATAGRIQVPTAPSMTINGGVPIGYYTYKVGGRTVQAMMRFDF